MDSGTWVSLYSGGKDSAAAFQRGREAGLAVERLLTVNATEDSYMYHVPATRLVGLAAKSIGVPVTTVDAPAVKAHDSGAQGDREIEPLERALERLDAEVSGGLAGVTVGAIESEFQASRVEAMCQRLGIDMYAPLWQEEAWALAEWVLDSGFEIRIIQVAAAGLDQSWLGRTLDREAFEELRELNEEYGVHLLGEGGEFETLVTDGPHMNRPIEITGSPVWDGTRGHFEIESARLG